MNILTKSLLFILIFGVGFGLGFFIPNAHTPTNNTEHTVHEHMTNMHSHESYSVPDGVEAPTLSLESFEDSKGGWNIRLVTENFTFSPENAGGDHVENQGHAHIFVDDFKLSRVYGDWFYLGAEQVPSGEHTISVTLNTNDHKEYTVDGEVVRDSFSVILP